MIEYLTPIIVCQLPICLSISSVIRTKYITTLLSNCMSVCVDYLNTHLFILNIHFSSLVNLMLSSSNSNYRAICYIIFIFYSPALEVSLVF